MKRELLQGRARLLASGKTARAWGGTLLLAWSLSGATSLAQVSVPGTFVLPSSAADTSQRGFKWRIHQVATWQPNNNQRTEDQLAGLLGVNIANPNATGIALAPASPANPPTAPISFDIGGVLNLDGPSSADGNFTPDDPMPGLPGTTGSYENAAADVLTWLDLPAGMVTLGVNSDDGFRMTLGGASPNDQFAVLIGEFNGGRPPGDSYFSINVPQAGLYAVRCTWEQGQGGASLEMFSLKSDGTIVLLNDVANGGIPAYRAVSVPARAYARKLVPSQGGSLLGNGQMRVEFVDGATPIDPATITLALDGTPVSASKAKSGNVTTVTYSSPRLPAPGSHTATFAYKENGVARSIDWNFTILNYMGPNGNFYEFVYAPNISWQDAETAAEHRSFLCGSKGHLVTITSAEEDNFVELLRQQYVNYGALPAGEVWAGGFQLPGQSGLGDGWFWVNNEGPIAPNNWGATYANWAPGEPNDCCNTWGVEDNEEQYLGLGYFGPGAGWIDDDVAHNNIVGYVVEYEAQVLAVDIKPGSANNPIQLDAPGVLPVAILSTATFDAATIDPSTVRFGRTGNETAPANFSLADVNGDKRKDLLCQFNIQDTGLQCGDTSAKLTANTYSGCSAGGSDAVQILRCPAYTLGVKALQDVKHLTDVYLTVTPALAGRAVPTVAQNVVLKSSDLFGKPRWTKTAQNVPLAANADGSSTGDLQYTSAVHGQNIKAQVQIKDSTTKGTQLLRQEGRVLYRPDLALANVFAPSEVSQYQWAYISASVRELKGDLGATATAYLKEGDTVLDSVNFGVGPAGEVGGFMAFRADTLGLHQLKLVIGNVAPGDYDLSNNEVSFAINVVQPPTYYSSYYSYNSVDEHAVAENDFWIFRYCYQYTNENVSQTLYLAPFFSTAPDRVQLQIALDGVGRYNFDLTGLTPWYGYDDGCYGYGSGNFDLGDGLSLALSSYRYCYYGYQYSYATFSRSTYKYAYKSSKYYQATGQTVNNPYGWDATYDGGTIPWLPQNSITTRFVVTINGENWGGNGDFGQFSRSDYLSPLDYYDWWWDPDTYSYVYTHITGESASSYGYAYKYDIAVP